MPTYTYYCIANGDNMSARSYVVRADGKVTRTCYIAGCLARIVQTISNEQAIREMIDLANDPNVLVKVTP